MIYKSSGTRCDMLPSLLGALDEVRCGTEMGVSWTGCDMLQVSASVLDEVRFGTEMGVS